MKIIQTKKLNLLTIFKNPLIKKQIQDRVNETYYSINTNNMNPLTNNKNLLSATLRPAKQGLSDTNKNVTPSFSSILKYYTKSLNNYKNLFYNFILKRDSQLKTINEQTKINKQSKNKNNNKKKNDNLNQNNNKTKKDNLKNNLSSLSNNNNNLNNNQNKNNQTKKLNKNKKDK